MRSIRRMNNLLFILIILLFVTPAIYGSQIEFTVSAGENSNVKFTSVAPLEKIIGETNEIAGMLSLDPDNTGAAITGEFHVQMGSLKTGNKIRDKHMRDNHLHTETYPTSSFILKKITGFPEEILPKGKEFQFKMMGDYYLHGITKEIEVESSAIWHPEKAEIHARGSFEVLLSDFEIPRPQFLVMKLGENQEIELNIVARKIIKSEN